MPAVRTAATAARGVRRLHLRCACSVSQLPGPPRRFDPPTGSRASCVWLWEAAIRGNVCVAADLKHSLNTLMYIGSLEQHKLTPPKGCPQAVLKRQEARCVINLYKQYLLSTRRIRGLWGHVWGALPAFSRCGNNNNKKFGHGA